MSRYAVIYKEQRSEHDHYDPEHPTTVTVDVLKEFDDQAKLLEWIRNNNDTSKFWNKPKQFRAFELRELTVETSISIKVTPTS